jgi:TolA-binding protein
VKRLFLIGIVLFVGFAKAQQNSGELQEEQDYAFSYGLFDDKLYQLSFEQFKKFIDQYPNSVKRPDAIFLSAESQFRLNQYQSAISIFKNFTQDYPKHKLRLDALFRLGEMNYALTM